MTSEHAGPLGEKTCKHWNLNMEPTKRRNQSGFKNHHRTRILAQERICLAKSVSRPSMKKTYCILKIARAIHKIQMKQIRRIKKYRWQDLQEEERNFILSSGEIYELNDNFRRHNLRSGYNLTKKMCNDKMKLAILSGQTRPRGNCHPKNQKILKLQRSVPSTRVCLPLARLGMWRVLWPFWSLICDYTKLHVSLTGTGCLEFEDGDLREPTKRSAREWNLKMKYKNNESTARVQKQTTIRARTQ